MSKSKSLLRTTVGVSLLIVLGKLLGFGREAVIAAFYGATAETDAFFFAFQRKRSACPRKPGERLLDQNRKNMILDNA